MEPLPTTRRNLIWLCMCPPDKSSSRWQRLAYAIYTIICLGSVLACFSGSLAFCIKFLSIDLRRSTFSFVFTVGEFSVIYMGLVAINLMRRRIDTIFQTLSMIYDASKWHKKQKDNVLNSKLNTHAISFLAENSDSFRFLTCVNNTSETLWKIYFKFVIPNVIIMNQLVAPLISILYVWLTNENLNVANLFRPLPLVCVHF